jgi:hypothetical protein
MRSLAVAPDLNDSAFDGKTLAARRQGESGIDELALEDGDSCCGVAFAAFGQGDTRVDVGPDRCLGACLRAADIADDSSLSWAQYLRSAARSPVSASAANDAAAVRQAISSVRDLDMARLLGLSLDVSRKDVESKARRTPATACSRIYAKAV